jgi:predicted DNA-binding transcriptional regulator AlpA
MNGMIRIAEFAELAGMSVRSLYDYHAKGLYDFPTPDHRVGTILFWRRAKAVAWARRRKRGR